MVTLYFLRIRSSFYIYSLVILPLNLTLPQYYHLILPCDRRFLHFFSLRSAFLFFFPLCSDSFLFPVPFIPCVVLSSFLSLFLFSLQCFLLFFLPYFPGAVFFSSFLSLFLLHLSQCAREEIAFFLASPAEYE